MATTTASDSQNPNSLFLMVSQLQKGDVSEPPKPSSFYFWLMTEDHHAFQDDLADVELDKMPILTMTRVARIKDMEKFLEVAMEVEVLQPFHFYPVDAVLPHEPKDSGLIWLMEAFTQFTHADESKEVFAQGDLKSLKPLLLAVDFTARMVREGQIADEDTPGVPLLDLLSDDIDKQVPINTMHLPEKILKGDADADLEVKE